MIGSDQPIQIGRCGMTFMPGTREGEREVHIRNGAFTGAASVSILVRCPARAAGTHIRRLWSLVAGSPAAQK
jgi:hypothetical protein